MEGVMPFLPAGIREVWGCRAQLGVLRASTFIQVPQAGASIASQVLLARTMLTHLFVNTHVMYVSL